MIRLLIATFCMLFFRAEASLLFNTDSEYFQQPFTDLEYTITGLQPAGTCSVLPDVGNLLYPEAFWYDQQQNATSQILNHQLELRWPPLMMFKTYEMYGRVDILTQVEDEEQDHLAGKKQVESQYFLSYKSDAKNERTDSRIAFDEELTADNLQHQTISDFEALTESIHQRDGRQVQCQVFDYHEKIFGVKQTMELVWRPRREQYVAYLGTVCLVDGLDAHAFIGTDGTGNQFTTFFDLETLHPFLVQYQSQRLLIRVVDWVARDPDSFEEGDFKLAKCIDQEGQEFEPTHIVNADAPMMHLMYFGLLS